MSSKQRLSPSDLFRVSTVSHLALHPSDGTAAVILRSAVDEARYETRLHWFENVADENTANQIADPLVGLERLDWSPNGERYAFVRHEGEGYSLAVGDWRGPSSLSRPSAVTRVTHVPGRITWSADGTVLALSLRVRTTSSKDRPAAVDGHYIMIKDRFPFKIEGGGTKGYWDGSYEQVFTYSEATNGDWHLRQLTDQTYDHEMPEVSPDGTQVLFVRPVSGPERLRGNQKLAVVDVATGVETVVMQMDGPCWYPLWDRRGEGICWLGHDSHMGATEATDIRLYHRPDGSAEPRELSAGLGRSVEDVIVDDCTHFGAGPRPPAWDPINHRVLALATNGGQTSLYRFDLAGPHAPEVHAGGDRRIFTFAQNRQGCLLASAAPDDPCRISFLDESSERVIMEPNRFWLKDRELSRPRRYEFAGAGGDPVEGWIVPPLGRPIEGSPAVAQINRGRFGWSFYFETQILAGSGFACGFVNPHGSYGYGEVFRASTHYQPATVEIEDILGGVDHLLELGVDASRIGINGASFGGFTVNWLAAHHSERFAAGVSQASYCNRHSLWGTSSIGPSRWDKPGAPWQQADFLLERSPLTFVEGVTIPLLLIHGELDTICPLEQAEQWFTALTMTGKEAAMLVLWGESHDLARSARPGSRTLRMSSILEWFQTHLGTKATDPQAAS